MFKICIRRLLVLVIISVILVTLIACKNNRITDSDTNKIEGSSGEEIDENPKSEDSLISMNYNIIPGNIADNFAWAVKWNDYIFYVNFEDGSKVYKENIRNSKRSLFLDTSVDKLMTLENYIIASSNNNEIIKIKYDGSEKVEVLKSERRLLSVFPYGNSIFYSVGGTLYKHNLNTEETTIILERATDDDGFVFQIRDMNIINDTIFFQDNKTYTINVSGQHFKSLYDFSTESLIYDDEWLYYINPGDERAVYRMKADGSSISPEKVFEDEYLLTDSINIYNGIIYYGVSKLGSELRLYNIDRSKTEIIWTFSPEESENIIDINIIGDWVYFTNYNPDTGKQALWRVMRDGSLGEAISIEK